MLDAGTIILFSDIPGGLFLRTSTTLKAITKRSGLSRQDSVSLEKIYLPQDFSRKYLVIPQFMKNRWYIYY